MSDFSDKELLEKFRNADTQHYAFNLIMRKYQQKVYYHIRRMLIDHDDTNDVVQNTFIKAWNGLSNFREDSQLFTWLYRVATNEALSFINQRKKTQKISMEESDEKILNQLHADKSVNANQLELKLQVAISKLPEQQRAVFNMRYYDEIKYEDMSKILGVTAGALKASYHHAVKKIEKFITDN